MLELGSFSDACHQEVGNYALNRVDKVFCYGKETLPIHKLWMSKTRPSSYFEDQQLLSKELFEELQEGDVVLIKGSHGTKMWQIIDQFVQGEQ